MMDLDVTLDTSQLDASLRMSGTRMKKALRRGFGETMSRLKYTIKQYINGAFRSQATQKIGNSLNHEIIDEGKDVVAIFGSEGPDFNGQIGVGIHSEADDDGNTWNLAQMYNEGIPARSFTWKGKTGRRTASQYGRQAGRAGGSSPWLSNKPFFYGAPRLAFIEEAEKRFNDSVERIVKRHIDREFQEVI
jgi:hypothetical protein